MIDKMLDVNAVAILLGASANGTGLCKYARQSGMIAAK